MIRPESRFTLSECFHKLYDKSDLTVKYLRVITAQLHSWERLTGSTAVGDVTNETVAQWRAAMVADGYSPATI
jgi:hypothetical protein